MRKVWHIAANEFINTILSKGFLIAVVMTPVFVLGSIVIQTFLQTRVDTRERKIAIVDRSGKLFAPLQAAAENRRVKIFTDGRQTAPLFTPTLHTEKPGENAEQILSARVRSKELSGFIIIDPEALTDKEQPRISYYTDTPTYTDVYLWARKALRDEIFRLRLKKYGINAKRVKDLSKGMAIKQMGLTAISEDGRHLQAKKINLGATFAVPAAAMFLLFLLVFMSAPMLLHSVIEEKQNRIWEVLVSSVTPFQLLLGKLLGIVMVSMSLSVVFLGGAVSMADVFNVMHHLKPSLFAWFLFFQLMGLLIYGSVFSAIGAVCSEIRDAQSLMMPAMLMIVIPMFGWVAILRAPASAFARGLSLFPPATPMLMLLRIALPPGPAAWEIALSIVLTGGFTLACVWAAGKIFRMGILAQGQTPTWGRLLSWILAK
jgi:ABC-2 type transport system permease protein